MLERRKGRVLVFRLAQAENNTGSQKDLQLASQLLQCLRSLKTVACRTTTFL